ncbi:MAG: long-chain fatty acid--CoA ligase [Alphaproteobacteria bacterium]|nr:long-chain fatty acid--CoA ligase [Alphaproteobacteria bacterium]MBV8548802.1 long-chain fatty acid--CoA ligase [Alphaproteobacteria bacterium]
MPAPQHLPWAKKYPASVDWSAPLPDGPLTDILDRAARDFAANPAIDFMGSITTYKELASQVAHAAKGLQRMGVKKGDRVGMFLPNTPTYVILYFAVLRVGGIVVNFNPLYAEREIEKQIKDSGCTIMATVDLPQCLGKLQSMLGTTCLHKIIVTRIEDLLPPVTGFLYSIFKRKDIARVPDEAAFVMFDVLMDNDGKPHEVAIDPHQDVAVLQYTGGTTGVPKGAMLTHANLIANVKQSQLIFAGVAWGQERMLGVLPFFHVFAMTAVMNFAVLIGGCIIMLPRFDLKQTVKTIHQKKPTLFPAVPTIYTAINHYKNLGRYNLRSIKYCISGGAPLPLEVKHDFEKLTGCIVVEGYGLSETSPVTHCNPVDGENKAGSIGLPLPQTTVEIVSLDDHQTILPQGETGEVCIRGPQVMKGYWRHAEETTQVMDHLPDGGVRLHTGDVGYLDPDGYTFIVDRIKDMIMAGGFKIYPRNVEEAIYQNHAVEECVVAGIPDAYRGQTVKAWIKLREGHALSNDALRDFLKDKLSPIEMPKQIEFRDSLPKTLIGKLSRKLMLEDEAAKAAAKA